MNEFHKLLRKTEDECDKVEISQAPSGEWSEYNMSYVEIQARWYAMEELSDAVGTCAECKHYDNAPPWHCRVKFYGSISRSPEFYCADFKRKQDV